MEKTCVKCGNKIEPERAARILRTRGVITNLCCACAHKRIVTRKVRIARQLRNEMIRDLGMNIVRGAVIGHVYYE